MPFLITRAARRSFAVAGFLVSLVASSVVPASAGSSAPAAASVLPSSEVARARSLAATGDYPGAIRALEPYVAAHPTDSDAGRYLGDLRSLAGDLPGAENAYVAVLTRSAGDRTTHDRLGNLYARQDRLDEAIAQFEKSLPDTAAFADLVRTHKRRGDLAAFVESYRREADMLPPTPVAQFEYGVILADLHDPDRALPYLEFAARANPFSCPANTELGSALIDLNQKARGIAAVRRCLDRNANDYDALVTVGAAEAPEDEAAAGRDLDHALALRPDRPEALVDLGYVADIAGHRDASIGFYRKAIALDPFSRPAYVDLGYDELQAGALLDAETTFLRGLSVSSDDGRIEYMLAETFERQGKHALAYAEYSNATHSDEPEVAAAAAERLADAHR